MKYVNTITVIAKRQNRIYKFVFIPVNEFSYVP